MTAKDKRREVRISADDDDLLAEAAGLTGVSVSEFLLDRAIADAATIVDAHRAIQLAEDDHRAVPQGAGRSRPSTEGARCPGPSSTSTEASRLSARRAPRGSSPTRLVQLRCEGSRRLAARPRPRQPTTQPVADVRVAR